METNRHVMGRTATQSGTICHVLLEPDAFHCVVHDLDLTRDVIAELEEIPVAGFATASRDPSKGSAGTPFTVVVSCPGPEPHRMVLKGRFHSGV